ncbi:uncharacterized protein LOC142227650 [Haematobia irritans]|uniref:uncharacterized protein LOC142227650 n=1 Tax=Haematobia irritans TaxID=7368 RepID=UPI003F5055FC
MSLSQNNNGSSSISENRDETYCVSSRPPSPHYPQHHAQQTDRNQEHNSANIQAYQEQKCRRSEITSAKNRKLYAIEEQHEMELEQSELVQAEGHDNAYDADVDDDVLPTCSTNIPEQVGGASVEKKISDDREHIYELFQPWAMKTYGDLAKTKTITMRKKVRILKALEGKEHSRPDSSKFRFWVKTKGFTTKRPESFEDAPCTQRHKKQLPPNAVLSDNPADVDLYVASTTKDLEKRTYRKVAVVEEFFDIIFQIHMELGGRSGMHAGQKRTYRIISETYAFLPREAVTRFLSICPECKKNLRPSSPSAANVKEDLAAVTQNESSSEVEVLNYSSHTESSLEAGPTTKTSTKTVLHSSGTGAFHSHPLQAKKRRYSNPDNNSKAFVCPTEYADVNQCLPRRNSSPVVAPASKPLPQNIQAPKIRINPHLQRPITPPLTDVPPFVAPYHGYGFDFHSLKSRDSLIRYYDFMRRLYSGNLVMPHAAAPQPSHHKLQQQNSNKPKITNLAPLCKKSAIQVHETCNSSSSDEETDTNGVTMAKRFKSSETTKALESIPLPLHIPPIDKDFIQSTQIRAINLSKNSSHFSSEGKSMPNESATSTEPTSRKASCDLLATSTPTSVKQEALTPPKSSALPALRIPQLRSIASLPPLDYERLKPITSTYLQLTRSMGLSDEEALRFDNLFIFSMKCLAYMSNNNELKCNLQPCNIFLASQTPIDIQHFSTSIAITSS